MAEVADTLLGFDANENRLPHVRGGVRDRRVIGVNGALVVAHRDPAAGDDEKMLRLRPTGTVAPLAALSMTDPRHVGADHGVLRQAPAVRAAAA